MHHHPVRIAVVGLGQFGVLHATTLSRLAGADLVALVDGNIEAAQRVAEGLEDVAVFASLEELIAAGLADAIVIATRADSHLALAEQAVRAGLHVLVEKPLANSAQEIRDFQTRLAGTQSTVMVDHLCLFHSLIVPLKERLDQTGFRALHFVRHRPESIGCRFPEDNPIQLTMVHDLYVALRLTKGEEPVSFHAMNSRNAAGRVDMSWAALRWADGRIATFQCHMMLPEGVPAEGWDSVEVFGDTFHSKVTTNPAPWTWTDSRTTWPVNLEIRESEGMLAALLKDFLLACHGRAVAEGCRVEDALQVQTWIDRLIATARQS